MDAATILDTTHRIKLNRTIYEGAFYSAGHRQDKVKLERLILLGDASNFRFRLVKRYVLPETKVTLIPIEEAE